jgi:hypothetical protein
VLALATTDKSEEQSESESEESEEKLSTDFLHGDVRTCCMFDEPNQLQYPNLNVMFSEHLATRRRQRMCT